MSVKSELRKAPKTALGIVLYAIYFLPSLILWAIGVKIAESKLSDRIGHLAIDMDCFLKELKLGSAKERRPIWLLPNPKQIANRALYDLWRSFFVVVSNKYLIWTLRPFRKFGYLDAKLSSYATVVGRTARCYAVYAAWGDRPPLVKLSSAERERGEDILRRLGLPAGAWFVCVHAREAGYAVQDDDRNMYRDCDISTFREAMEEIIDRGGWCIRMGHHTAQPLPPTDKVVDYARSKYKSEWMDIFLCAQCRFFLGSSSGLYNVASIFGVPVATVNTAPLDCTYLLNRSDLSIPKLVTSADGEVISFVEALGSPVGSHRYTADFERNGLKLIPNSDEEIGELAVEMFDRLEGKGSYTERDELLQQQFRDLFRPGHFGYGSVARIGRHFLRRHASLLEPARASASRPHLKLPL